MTDEERGQREREHAKKVNGQHKPPTGPTFNVVTDVLTELPAQDYLSVALALAPGAPIGVFSFAWGGKSVILQDLVLSIATDQPIWGQFPTKGGAVLHVDHEQGERETRDRYQRLARARGIKREDIGDRIRLAALPSIYLPTPGAEDAYKRALDGCALGYIDSLAAAQPGILENETQFAENLYMLGRVSEATGAAIIVAGHTGKGDLSADKPGDGRTLPRGTSAIIAACSVAYALSGGKGEPKLVSQIKGRSLSSPSVENFYLELATVRIDGYRNPNWAADPGGFSVTYRTVEQVKAVLDSEALRTARAAIVAALRETPGIGTVDLRKAVGGKATVVDQAIASMLKSGDVVDQGNARGHRYALSAEGIGDD